MQWIANYLMLGLFVGYLSGLLGVGGGLVMVPVLTFMFETQHFPPNTILHMALGTSMAAIFFTTIFTTYQHHKHQAVNWKVVRYMTPGVLLGTAVGGLLVGFVATRYLTFFFVFFVYAAGIQILVGFKPEATRELPSHKGLTFSGMVIGCISGIVSIGGGVLSVPYLLWHKEPLRNAIATASALGFFISCGGTIGYVLTGHYKGVDLPPFSMGYVYLPVLIWLIVGSLITAPIGAKGTHNMPVGKLKRFSGLLLCVLATKMLFKLF